MHTDDVDPLAALLALAAATAVEELNAARLTAISAALGSTTAGSCRGHHALALGCPTEHRDGTWVYVEHPQMRYSARIAVVTRAVRAQLRDQDAAPAPALAIVPDPAP